MCVSIFINMEKEHVNKFNKMNQVEEMNGSVKGLVNVSESVVVFKEIDLACSSELSSLCDEEPDVSKKPKKQIRKHIVIGKHIEVVEGEERKFKCTICKCKFSLKQQVKYHDYCATGERPLKCELCDKSFVKKSHLLYHMRTHTGESPFKCSFCTKSFKQRDKLIRHEKTHKESGIKEKFNCRVCKKDYSDRDSLKKHSLKHTNAKKFNCKHCDNKYVDKFTLNQHLAAHLSPKYICNVCGRKFRRKNSLNVHMQMHEDVYPHQCSECKKTFRTKKELIQHSVVHDKDNPGFECAVCSITCGRKDNLLRHVRNCHLDPCTKKEKQTKPSEGLLKLINEDLPPNNTSLVDECSQIVSQQVMEHRPTDTQNEGLLELRSINGKETSIILDKANKGSDPESEMDNETVQKSINSICTFEKFAEREPIAVDQNSMNRPFHDSGQEQVCNRRKSVLVSRTELSEQPIDLSQTEAPDSKIQAKKSQQRELPAYGKTSVIVHTSSFVEHLTDEANVSREPVIKFLRPTVEHKSPTPEPLYML